MKSSGISLVKLGCIGLVVTAVFNTVLMLTSDVDLVVWTNMIVWVVLLVLGLTQGEEDA